MGASDRPEDQTSTPVRNRSVASKHEQLAAELRLARPAQPAVH